MVATWTIEATVHAPTASENDPAPYSGPDSFTFVCLKLRDPDGVEGYGFTGRFLAQEVAHFLNRTLPGVLNSPEEDPVDELARKFNPRHLGGVVVSALSALEVALTDIHAKRAGLSAAKALGGQRTSAPVHVTCGFPELDIEKLVAACEHEMSLGATGVKVLIAAKGRSVAEDLARLTEVRSAIGTDADLIADANCMMNFETARRFVEGGHDLGLTWLEEPVVANDIGSLTKLSQMGVPLGAGQMEQNLERHRALRSAGVRVIQPNAVFLGGFQKAIHSAVDAASKGACISMAGGWDFVNLHWICGALNDGAVELHRAQFRIARLLMRDMPEIANGHINVPDRLGLGLDPDDDALAACRIF